MYIHPSLGVWHLHTMCCRFPGSKACYEHVMEVVDADILADAAVWTATHKAAWNNEFNCSNGDTFRWAEVQPAPLLQLPRFCPLHNLSLLTKFAHLAAC